MAMTDPRGEESVSSEPSDKISINPAIEKSQVLSGTEGNGTTLQPAFEYVTGWKLQLISIGICLALFIGQMESTIVSTAVITITDDLGGYNQSVWVFTAYMLTYSGLLIIWAKLSDIFGRKRLLLVAVFIFIVASGACGASQTLVQLIMFRWVQGIGGCGIYSIGTLLFFELVPPSRFADFTALVTAVVAFALAAGPLLGGAISDNTTWRWIFLLNIPVGVLSLALLAIILPRKLPNEPAAGLSSTHWSGLSLRLLRKVDLPGAFLLLGACLLLATALQLAAKGASFAAPKVLPLIVISGAMWGGFVIWEWFITTRRSNPEPVFPWRFFQSRVSMGMILNSYFAGTISTTCVVQIPQRFITVNGLSPFDAGVRLLPFAVLVPGMSSVAAMLMKKMVAPIYILIAGAILNIVGTVCLSMTDTSPKISASQYGFQILIGSGVGFVNSALLLLVPFVMKRQDLAVGMAAMAQFRILGGIVGLAIVTTVMNRWITSPLLEILDLDQVKAILETTDALSSFPQATQLATRAVFGEGYNLQVKILIGFAAAQVLATALMWEKKIVMIRE